MKVLVAGASGLIGQATMEEFALRQGWEVVGVSRRSPAEVPGTAFISLDLLDSDACDRAISPMTDVTHLVYAALQEEPGLFAGWLDADLMERNLAMLRNLFEPLARSATNLQHVTLMHGTKAYGLHHPSVGYAGVKIPLRERDPRKEHPNFYFLQEDYLHAKQREAGWAMTVYRPTVVYGDAPGNNMNPTLAIAAYAAILRERAEPLFFPGAGEEQVLREAVDARLVARAVVWGATAPAARNETFNLTNGDSFIWENVWPAIAESLGMEPGPRRPFSFATDLPALDSEWAALVDRYALRSPKRIVEFVGYNSLVYTDMVLSSVIRPPVPALNSTIKVRQAGFNECLDTEDMFREQFRRLQELLLIPSTKQPESATTARKP